MKFKNDIEAQARINIGTYSGVSTLGDLSLREDTTLSTVSKSIYVSAQNSGRASIFLDTTAQAGVSQIGFGPTQYAAQNTSGSIEYTNSSSTLVIKTNYQPAITIDSDCNVSIGTTSPKAKLDINGHFCVDSKTHTVTNAFTTCLTVNLTSHTGCHVVITAFGDWGGHSSAAYRGEFFLQNGGNQYNEPGIILRQDDNTFDGTDQIICQIVDPSSTANPKDFQIQIRHTDTTSPESFTAQLTYTVQGKFNSIT